MKRTCFFILITLFSTVSFAQYITVEQYIKMHQDLAIREMKRMGIPAAITLAQGLLETENGNSELLKKSNNHFGIKCKNSCTAPGVSHDDDAKGECFRTYKDAEGSYRDHSNYLRGNDRYAFLFKLDPRDYKGWAYGLKKAGYATNPRYPEILIKNIEQNNLQQYTLVAVNEIPVFDASKYKSDPEEKAIDEITTGTTKTRRNDMPGSTPLIILHGVVNGCKTIYANKGKSLLAIATENNISLARLLEFNDLYNDGLLGKDQYIFLEKKQKEGPTDFYIIHPYESIYEVAQINGIRLQNLMEYNHLTDREAPAPGTKLFLKPQEFRPENVNNSTVKTHAVQPREGLYTISKKYGVSVAQIKEWNQLVDDTLKIGQQLIISK